MTVHRFSSDPAVGGGARSRRRGRYLAGLAVGAVVVLTLSACGSSSSPSSSASSAPAGGQSDGPGGRSGPPGVTGTIAAASPGSLQVQNPQSGQVRVDYTSGTTLTRTVAATRSAVAVGDCVTALSGNGAGGGAGGGGTPGGGGGGTPPSAVTAASVIVSLPVNGSCLGGAGRGSGGTPRPSASAGGGARFGGGGGGKVTAMNPTGFVLARTSQTGVATTETVTTTSGTTYMQTESATAAALVVGQCATAFGPSDDTGAVTATSISVRPPGPNGCAGFGRGGRGGGNAA